jgi:hypothetical protein
MYTARNLKKFWSFTFCSIIRTWENVTVEEMYVVLAMFILMGIVQKPTHRSYYSNNCLLFIPFFLERQELIQISFTFVVIVKTMNVKALLNF